MPLRDEPPAARHRLRRPTDGATGGIEMPAGHGHSHGSAGGPALRTDRRVRIVLAALLVPCALLTLLGMVLLFPFQPRDTAPIDAGPRVDGHVTAAIEQPCDDEPGVNAAGVAITCLALTVRLDEGPLAGQVVVTGISAPQGRPPFGADTDVVLTSAGGDPADPNAYQIVDVQRGQPLLVLAVVFAAAVFTLARWRGLAALGGLGFTAVVLVGFVLPALLDGRDPLPVSVVGSCAIMFGALYLTHGFSARTSTAVLGTLASLLLIALLGITFIQATHLLGVGEDIASLEATLDTAVDGRGLLLAGLVIGALGALDDVTVTQTTAVWELRAANPDLPRATLFRAAMRIGRDHVASSVNTLVLAYAGTALPLLLLFSANQRGLADTLTTQVIATEVVRTLVGTIGLVASVPLTTAMAVTVAAGGRARRAQPARPG